jgi:hypothetical protein
MGGPVAERLGGGVWLGGERLLPHAPRACKKRIEYTSGLGSAMTCFRSTGFGFEMWHGKT